MRQEQVGRELYTMSDEDFQAEVYRHSSRSALAAKFRGKKGIPSLEYITRRILLRDVDTRHFRTSKPTSELDDLKMFYRGSGHSATAIRRAVYTRNLIPYRCQKCGIAPGSDESEIIWDGQPLTLQLDHINGDPSDHRLTNLRYMCPNCHSQTPTFSGRGSKFPKGSSCDLKQLSGQAFLQKISSASSVRQALKLLGMPPGTKSYQRFHEKIAKEGLDISFLYASFRTEGKRSVKNAVCPKCGAEMCKRAEMCRTCYTAAQIAASPRPPLPVLLADLVDGSYEAVGRKYGVTGNAVKNWLKNFGHDFETRPRHVIPAEEKPDPLVLREDVAREGYGPSAKKYNVDRTTLKAWITQAGLELPDRRQVSVLETMGIESGEIVAQVEALGYRKAAAIWGVTREVVKTRLHQLGIDPKSVQKRKSCTR